MELATGSHGPLSPSPHAQVLQDVRHSMHSVTDVAAVPTMFKTKETAATVTWSGALEIGDQMKISVKVRCRRGDGPPLAGHWAASAHSVPVGTCDGQCLAI